MRLNSGLVEPIPVVLAFYHLKSRRLDINKLETFEDALFEGGKISTLKTEELEH